MKKLGNPNPWRGIYRIPIELKSLKPTMGLGHLIKSKKVANWLINQPIPKIPLTYPYATLHNYQNSFMYKSELKTHPTLISHANKENELKAGTTGTHSIGSIRNKFWNWLNTLLQRVKCTLIPYVYYNKTLSFQVRDLLSITCKLPMN